MKDNLIKIGMIGFDTTKNTHTDTVKNPPFFFDLYTPSICRFKTAKKARAEGGFLEVPQ